MFKNVDVKDRRGGVASKTEQHTTYHAHALTRIATTNSAHTNIHEPHAYIHTQPPTDTHTHDAEMLS